MAHEYARDEIIASQLFRGDDADERVAERGLAPHLLAKGFVEIAILR